MTSTLAETSTSSFLVGKECITSVQSIANPIFKWPIHTQSPQWNLLQEQIPGPDQTWQELVDKIAALTLNLDLAHQQIAAKDSTIAASNAQLAVQGVYNKQLNDVTIHMDSFLSFSHLLHFLLIVLTLTPLLTHCSHTCSTSDSLFSHLLHYDSSTPIVLLLYIWLDTHL